MSSAQSESLEGIENKALCSAEDASREMPLYYALHSEPPKLDVIKCLIEKGARVNDRYYKQKTPLHTAVENNSFEVAKFLIENGADITAIDVDGNTALHLAISSINPNLDMIKYLVEKKALVNAKNSAQWTALHSAVRKSLEIVKFLFENGADITAEDESHETPLHVAVHSTFHFDVIKFLVEKGAHVNVKNWKGETPLHLAAVLTLEIVEFLIENGADVKALNIDDNTPLHYAVSCEFPSLDVIQFLVQKGAAVNARSKDLVTPLQYAVRSSFEIIKYLVDNGADVTNVDEYHDTPLHDALNFETPNLDVIRYLVEKGASINTKGMDGKTPLHYAVQKSAEIAKFLIEKGADISIKDEKGNTPLEYNNFESLKEYLEPKNRTSRSIKYFMETEATKPLPIASVNAINGNEIFSSVAEIPYNRNPSTMELTYSTQQFNNAQQISSSNALLTAENLAFIGCIAETLDDSANKRYQRLQNLGVNVIPSTTAAVYDAREKFYELVEEKIGALSSESQDSIREELDKVDSDIVESLVRGVEFSGLVGLDHVLGECKKCFENNLLRNAIDREEI